MELGVYSFGDIHPDPVTREQASPGQRMRDLLERIRLAEQVGLDFFGIGEHHRAGLRGLRAGTVLAAAAGRRRHGSACRQRRHGASAPRTRSAFTSSSPPST